MAITGFWTEGLVGSPDNMNKTLLQFATLASRDAAADEGIMFIPTDEDILYRDNGSTWDKIAQMIGISGGDRFIDTEDGGLLLTLEATDQPAAPDGQAFHIWVGTAGSITANDKSPLVVESSDVARTVIQILGPTASEKSIYFGDPAAARSGALRYYGSGDTPSATLGFTIGTIDRLHYSAAAFAFQEATNISTTTGNLTLTAPGNLVFAPAGDIDLPITMQFLTIQSLTYPAARTIRQVVQSSGNQILYEVENTSTESTNSRAKFRATVKTQSTGDPTVVLEIDGTQVWNMGIDNSASDRYSIGEAEVPGTTDAMRIAVSSHVVTWDDSTFGSDFDYVCDQCGRHELNAFMCCGVVKWHDDVLALRKMVLSPAGLDHMVKLGVMHVDGPNDSDPGWIGINIQPAMHMTWAGMWQNRVYLDNLAEENRVLRERLDLVEVSLN